MSYLDSTVFDSRDEDMLLFIPPIDELSDEAVESMIALNGVSGFARGEIYPDENYYLPRKTAKLSAEDIRVLYDNAMESSAVMSRYDGDRCIGHMISLNAPMQFKDGYFAPDFNEVAIGPALDHDAVRYQEVALQEASTRHLYHQKYHDASVVQQAKSGNLRYSAAPGTYKGVDVVVVAHVDQDCNVYTSSEVWVLDEQADGNGVDVAFGADTMRSAWGNATEVIGVDDIYNYVDIAGDSVRVDKDAVAFHGEPLGETVVMIPLRVDVEFDGAVGRIVPGSEQYCSVDLPDDFQSLHTRQLKARSEAEEALEKHYRDDPYGKVFHAPRQLPTEAQLRNTYIRVGDGVSDDLRENKARHSVASRVGKYRAQRAGRTFAQENEGWEVV